MNGALLVFALVMLQAVRLDELTFILFTILLIVTPAFTLIALLPPVISSGEQKSSPRASVSKPLAKLLESDDLLGICGYGVDDGVRTRDFRSHSPALYR